MPLPESLRASPIQGGDNVRFRGRALVGFEEAFLTDSLPALERGEMILLADDGCLLTELLRSFPVGGGHRFAYDVEVEITGRMVDGPAGWSLVPFARCRVVGYADLTVDFSDATGTRT